MGGSFIFDFISFLYSGVSHPRTVAKHNQADYKCNNRLDPILDCADCFIHIFNSYNSYVPHLLIIAAFAVRQNNNNTIIKQI